MKRGPKKPTAAQGDFLAGRAAQRPTVQPAQPAAKPNPFSASGTSTAPTASTGIGQSSSGASSIPSPSTGAISTPASLEQVPSASGQMKRGGPVQKFAAGGTTETNQSGSWGGANAANAVSANPATYTGAPGYTSPTTSTSGPFSTTPGTSPIGTTPATPGGYAGEKPYQGGGMNAGYNGVAGNGGPAGAAYFAGINSRFGLAGGYNNPGYDGGGDVLDPGGVDPTQGQEGQAGDLSGALNAVQQAYQYGLQQITGNIPTAPAGPGGDQTQGGPQDRGNQLAANIPMVPAGPGGDQPNPNPFPTKTAPVPFGKRAEGADYTAAVARGGSVPSLDAGGVMPPPAAPQPQQPTPAPAGGGVQGNQPPQLMRYLTGADAAPIPHVLRTMQTMQGHGRAARVVASGQTPQQKYAILQALRRLSDNAGTHAKVSLTGNGKIPASLSHAVMFANKKFEYQPTPYHVSFALKGKGKPTNQAARGGAIQAFDDGGDVNPDPTQQLADAGAPITMDVLDLQNGQTQNQDITPDQLQSLTSGTFDSYVAHPTETLSQAVERAQTTGEEGGIYGPIQRPQGTVGERLRTLAPAPLKDLGQNNQGNPPGEADISGTMQPNFTQERGAVGAASRGELTTMPGQPSPGEAAQMGRETAGISATSPGGQMQLGEHGQPGTTTSPGQPTPGEGREISANPNWGPIDTTPDTGIQVWNSQTGKWEDSTPEAYDAIRGKDPNAPVRIPDPANPDAWKTVSTAYFNQNYRQITNPGPQQKPPASGGAGKPDVTYGAADRTTEPVDLEDEGRQPATAPNVVRYGIGQSNAIQAARTAEAGEAAIPAARGGGGNAAARGAQATRPARGSRPARATRPARAARPTRAPRRVYGRGHAGLGTYQELADGTAQYLGPQNLTG